LNIAWLDPRCLGSPKRSTHNLKRSANRTFLGARLIASRIFFEVAIEKWYHYWDHNGVFPVRLDPH
jgi:hypothetical protein